MDKGPFADKTLLSAGLGHQNTQLLLDSWQIRHSSHNGCAKRESSHENEHDGKRLCLNTDHDSNTERRSNQTRMKLEKVTFFFPFSLNLVFFGLDDAPDLLENQVQPRMKSTNSAGLLGCKT